MRKIPTPKEEQTELSKIFGPNILKINAKKCDNKNSWHSTKEIKTLLHLSSRWSTHIVAISSIFFFNSICLFQASLFLCSLAVLYLRGHGKVASMKSVQCRCPYSITKHHLPEGKQTTMGRVERGMSCTNTDRDFFTLFLKQNGPSCLWVIRLHAHIYCEWLCKV